MARRDRPVRWKREAAALACGLLLGAAWEAAHAEPTTRARVAAAAAAWHKGP